MGTTLKFLSENTVRKCTFGKGVITMSGHVVKRGKKYSIVVEMGNDETGKRRQKWYSGYRTKKEAETDLHRILHELRTGQFIDTTKLTTGQWLDRWWAALSPAGRARVAGLSLNCYAETADCQAIVAAVRQWGQERGVTGPVVLKEFFDPELVPWLEAQNVYYAWFLARVPDGITPTSVWGRPLFDEDGLTPWGHAYRRLP